MSLSSRPDQFFQTDSALDEVNRKARKSYNVLGNPIKLPSKILAVIPDPAHHDAVYVAESAATVKRVALDAGKITQTYRGPDAPLTSLCLSADGTKLYAGCWDKLIWGWDVATGTVTVKMQGHRDFVKAVTFLATSAGQGVLVSGGADGDVLIWDAETGLRSGTLRGQSRAIQSFALDPLQEDLRLSVAFSDPGIRHFALSDLKDLRALAFSPPILAHDTSVYRLCFDSEGDLWTASADKTAKHLVRADNWQSDTALNHPDFVRDVLVHERYGWTITACRDEEVRVWNLSTGVLHHTFSGHFEEVTGLCLVGDKVVSVSIDATIRQWSLHPKDLQNAKLEAADPENAVEESTQKVIKTKNVQGNIDNTSALTEEEERELAELMGNEESELQGPIPGNDQ